LNHVDEAYAKGKKIFGENVSNPARFLKTLSVAGAYVILPSIKAFRMNDSLALENSTQFAYSARLIIDLALDFH
jgi:hypothetical protein